MGTTGMFIEHSYPGLISTSSWIHCLEDDPTAHGYSIYGFLERRRTDAAIEIALEHIKSDDDYLWLNSAIYLGSRDRKEAIPYLIKSIRHTASVSVEDRIRILERLSGKNFGSDFSTWRKWYISNKPQVIPDWESSLGHNPKIGEKASDSAAPTHSPLRLRTAGHDFKPVKSYEEITKYGLEARIYVDDNGIPRLLQIDSKDKTKPQPKWMQAFYLAPADALTAHAPYIFDQSKPDRVGVMMGFTEKELDGLAIITERLWEDDTFEGKQYLAFSLKDLAKWNSAKMKK